MASKRSAAKLGFGLLLKFFAAHGRFPRERNELPPAGVELVPAAEWASQGGDGQKQVLELSMLPGVENVALAPSQGHERP